MKKIFALVVIGSLMAPLVGAQRRLAPHVGAKRKHNQEELCTCCQEKIDEKPPFILPQQDVSMRTIRLPACGHRFHFKHYADWVLQSQKTNCPVCRQPGRLRMVPMKSVKALKSANKQKSKQIKDLEESNELQADEIKKLLQERADLKDTLAELTSDLFEREAQNTELREQLEESESKEQDEEVQI